MKHETEASQTLPLHDYSRAVQSAVSWLGDRYLLAEPARRPGTWSGMSEKHRTTTSAQPATNRKN